MKPLGAICLSPIVNLGIFLKLHFQYHNLLLVFIGNKLEKLLQASAAAVTIYAKDIAGNPSCF